ncbi:MAG: hypothetical protein KGO02_21690 [Alphaproteobacteria bacterium]|nr:hypothetical protein [Alphaproteobacteria bacterium]
MGIAASISTIGTGYIDEVFGSGAGFIAVTIIALLATGLTSSSAPTVRRRSRSLKIGPAQARA